ncbi:MULTISPECIES: cupin domain-containing protein [Cellulomonas]|uniref:cupin domain-containing protein n=1 Tax=Cellulomonas TaxID=1707 RepID=UPI0010A81836|nr:MULTISPECIES: cupin domain-containing protein [Cellulomonas]
MEVEQGELAALDGAPGVAMRMLSAGTSAERVRVDLAVLEPGASLPRHPAGREQVFFVVSGQGRVAGDDDVERPVGPGSLVRWVPGEQHTSWADTRMTVVIVQRAPVDPAGGAA